MLTFVNQEMIARNCLDCADSALSGETQLLNGMFLLDQEWKLGRLPQKNERSAGEILYGAFDKSPLLLGSSNPESQRRGADLSLSLLKLLPTDRQEKRVRRLLAIPLETSAERNLGSAEACRGTCLASTLVSAAPEIKTETLANDMAARLIEAAGEHDLVMTCRVLGGLADLADLTRPEIRNRIVGVILNAVADRQLDYSPTSGVYSPPKDCGAEALATLAELLTLAEDRKR
jgi:hypothetical protein